MEQSPNPETFATVSFYLSGVSGLIFLFALAISLLFRESEWATVVQQVCWLSIFTSGIGAFLGYAAKTDFERRGASGKIVDRARFGWRFNIAFFGLMAAAAIFFIASSLAQLTQPPTPPIP